jgi:hypothetical protein
MDISPYLRKPLRSLQEVEETRQPRPVAGEGLPASEGAADRCTAVEEQTPRE